MMIKELESMENAPVGEAREAYKEARKKEFGVYADVEEPGRVRVGNSVLPV